MSLVDDEMNGGTQDPPDNTTNNNNFVKVVDGQVITDPAFVPFPTEQQQNNHNQSDGTEDEMSDKLRVRTYPPTHKGPFVVYVRASKSQSLRHLQISKYLFGKYNPQTIGKVSQMNNHKLRIEFKTAEAANSLVTNPDTVFKPYRVYIPADQVEVEGIVRLSTEDSEFDFLTNGCGKFSESNIPDVKIIDVFRFEKVEYDNSGVVINKSPTPLVRVTFPGNLLPRRAELHGLLIPIEPYKRKAMFCENCLRTGHTEKFCVVKPKCSKCGADHKTNVCTQTPLTVKCFVCGTAHDPNNRKICPKIKQANVTQQQQTKKKIFQSYAHAVRQVNSPSNQYEILSVDEDDDETETEMLTVPPVFAFRGTKRRKTIATPATGDGAKARPTSVTRPSAKESGPSTSSVGRSRDQNGTSGPKKVLPRKKDAPKEANQTNQTFIHNLRPLLNNFVDYLPIDTTWKQLIHTALNFLLDTLYPVLYPLLAPLITSLIERNFNGC